MSSTVKKRALVLFAHGARDSAWAAPFVLLQELTQASLPDVSVFLAFLELMTPKLPDLVPELERAGCTDVTVVPVFLGKGGHVARDLPVLIDQIKMGHPEFNWHVAGAAGEDAAVLNAIAQYCVGVLPP